jgi:hypothetical protein
MKVSFDYDGTLDQEEVLDYAKELIETGHELWIVTMRHANRKDGNKDIYSLAQDLDVPESRIIFTEGKLKAEWFGNKSGFAFHLDDCEWQCNNLKNVLGVYYEPDGGWKSTCDASLI